jgi:sensor histidine kinase regulating citrate/malate metabolism
MDQESRGVSLKWKIGGTYTAVMLVLSVFVIVAMYQLTNKMLRDQLDKRALAVATNLSDATAGHLVGRNLLALHALLRKYSLLDGVAYAFVEDNKGEIIAHTLETSLRKSGKDFLPADSAKHDGENYHGGTKQSMKPASPYWKDR